MTRTQTPTGLERLTGAALKHIIMEIKREQPFETINGLAEYSGLAWGTVQNLFDGTTKYPRFSTVHRLSMASGITWTCHEDGSISFKHVRMRKVG